jgi:hypothetical protein
MPDGNTKKESLEILQSQGKGESLSAFLQAKIILTYCFLFVNQILMFLVRIL